MAEAKLKIGVNKAEVMADLNEIKAELSEIDVLTERIVKEIKLMIELLKGGE